VAIYFGSQTGTAEKFSNVLAEEAHIIGAHEQVIDMEKFTAE
jgi:sulfite reductase alpha subunit-like flavoprotein